MKTSAFLVVLGACLVLPAASAAPATAPAEYRFAPGDVIDVMVTPQRTYDQAVAVQPDGKISYPLVGPIQAAGLTVVQLAEELRQALNRDLVAPRVTVSLKEMHRQALARVSVLGAVRTPGSYEIKEGATLAELLATAGGQTTLADLRRVTVTRADRSVRTVDLSQTEKTGRLERDALLQPGDFIVVPEGTPSSVMVLGEVAKPGPYEIHAETRILDVVMQAGGPTAKADLGRVTLRREGIPEQRLLNLQPLLRDMSTPSAAAALLPTSEAGRPAPIDSGGAEANLVLQPGDLITLPETNQQVYVFGRVGKPGLYPFKPTDRLLDALAMADGATADGDLSKLVHVHRSDTGEPVSRQLDMKKIVAQGKMEENELLRPGDVLYVPDKKPRRTVNDLSSFIWSITGLATLIRL